MVNGRLFYDDEFEALSLTISSSERTIKDCALHLFPHMKMESAYAKLKACLNPERDERLTFGQIIALCRFCGRFDALYHFCDETMHARPDRKAPEDEEVRLVDALNSASLQMARAMKQLDQLQVRKAMKVA